MSAKREDKALSSLRKREGSPGDAGSTDQIHPKGQAEAIALALELALFVHREQVDKAEKPYILHPLRVMMRLATDAERVVGLLHNTVEDSAHFPDECRITLEKLREIGFSEEIVVGVDALTRREGETYDEFAERLAPNPLARRVKLADLRDNLDLLGLNMVGEKDLPRLYRYLEAVRKLEALG